MVKNIGSADRVIRLIIGLALIGLPILSSMAIYGPATLKIASIALGTFLSVTALYRLCPIYQVLGLKTRKV